MLRALVVLLLLANALVFAWTAGALDGLLGPRIDREREPERLQRQVNPEHVKLLPPAAASAALAAASAAAADGLCLESEPLPATALADAERAMLAAGVAAGSWTTSSGDPKGLYLIYMGRYEDEETLQRKLEEIKRRRIDGRPARQPDLQPGIEVASFDNKAAADEELARLAQRGLRTARVVTVSTPVPQVRLRLAQADPALREALAGLKLAPGLGGFAACAPALATPAATPGSGAGAAAPASAAAVPAATAAASRPAAPASTPRTAAVPASRSPAAAASRPAAPASAVRPAGVARSPATTASPASSQP